MTEILIAMCFLLAMASGYIIGFSQRESKVLKEFVEEIKNEQKMQDLR